MSSKLKISRAKLRRLLKDIWDIALISDGSADTQREAKQARNHTVEEFMSALDKDAKSTASKTIRTLIRKPKKRKSKK